RSPGDRWSGAAASAASATAAGGLDTLFHLPMMEVLQNGLAGDQDSDYYDKIQESFRVELEAALTAAVGKTSVGRHFFPAAWVPDRTAAALRILHRPTNKLLLLEAVAVAAEELRRNPNASGLASTAIAAAA
ncbi:unnamed protein product, partial [Phaeothamnion confervicola]